MPPGYQVPRNAWTRRHIYWMKSDGNAVLDSIREVCTHRKWNLRAAHVRSTHVHAVVKADDPPEKIMGDFKSYVSRRLNETGVDATGGSVGS